MVCSLFLVISSISFAGDSKIVVYIHGQDPITYEGADDYKVITKHEYEQYQALIEIQKDLALIKAPAKPEKKNRITLYGGVNQGALTVTESYRPNRTRDVTIHQRSIGISGVGYSRNVWESVSLSTIFIYQGIYVGGVGYDF